MPLPKEPLTIRGGCSCGAIRYRIAVPALPERPLHYSYPASTTLASHPTAARLPVSITDHCNSCRGATASILPAWLLTPPSMFTLSCLPATTASPPAPSGNGAAPTLLFPTDEAIPRLPLAAPDRDDAPAPAGRPAYGPGHALLAGRDPAHGTWLRFYASTYAPDAAVKRVVRSFCGRCGTSLCYVADPMPFGIPDMIDVILGTVDREDLAQEYLRPDHQLFWRHGIPWVQDLVRGAEMSKHPSYKLTETVEE